MEATAQRTGLMYRPEGLVVAFWVAVAIWRFGVGTPVQWLLLTITGLFLFALKRPVWAMAAYLVSFLTLNNYMVTTPMAMSFRSLLLVLALAVVFYTMGRGGIELGPKAKRILIPAIILVGLSVVANLINSGTGFAFQDFRQMLVGMLIIILLPAVTRNLRDLKILCGVALVGMAASATIAIMQHYNLLGMGGHYLMPDLYASADRAPGMAATPLELSFVLASALPVLLGVYLNKGVKGGTWWFLGVSVVLVGLAVYFTYTRSAVLAMALGILALTPLLGRHMRGKVLIGILIVAFVFYQVTIVQNTRLASSSDTSAASRDVLRQAGIAIVKENPILGIGGNNFKIVSLQHVSEIDPAAMQWAGAGGDLGALEPHNDFVALAAFYGIPALLVYLWLLAVVLLSLRDSYRVTKRRFIKGLAIGLVGAIVAYLANAYYHNMLASMPLFWVIVGFSLATTKLALTEKKPRQKV